MYNDSILIPAVILILGVLALIIFRPKRAAAASDAANSPTLSLQLQAYERLVILAERIGLRNLIGNQPTEGLSAKEYQATLVDAIKREFEYNVSQQIYVAPKAWEAVQNLKESNIYVINQLGSFLNGQAVARDLARAIAEYLSGQEQVNIQQIVIEGLNIEAKRLMK